MYAPWGFRQLLTPASPLSLLSRARHQEKHDRTCTGRIHLLTLCDACVKFEGQGWLEGLGENGHPASAADVTLEAAERSIVEKVSEISHLAGFRAMRQTVFSEPSKARRARGR